MRKNSLAETQMALITSDKEFKERLIKAVKKEVKQIMEEAVTRKFVHQDSSSVTSLCAAVECCLSHGLRRRALGLFRTSSTTALMHKVAKTYRPAETVSKLILEAEAAEGVKRSSSSGDSTTRMLSSAALGTKPPLQKRNSGSQIARSVVPKYLWIRIALFERILVGIIEHLVDNHQKYYEKDALVADPEYGSVLSHLLVGPCALEYTRMKTQDHYWTDPPADELVQRHRISSGAYGSAGSGATSPANRRPGLQFRKLISAAGSSGDGGDGSVGSSCGRSFHSSTAIDYVESLHQNNKVVLLYGKNNVLVLPRDLTEPIPGYLSLHQSGDNLTLKWTPNQLMNGAIDCDGVDKSAYWDYALHVNLHDIVYVHCHQQGSDAGGTMVLVGQDGVQRPAIHFPAGGHLLAFLTCLETALQPHGRLDPPLWSQTGKGKVFPKIKRKGAAVAAAPSSTSAPAASVNCKDQENGNCKEEPADSSAAANETSDDYVFRIMFNNISENAGTETLEEGPTSVIGSGSPAGQMAAASSPRSPRWWLSGRGHSRPFRSADSMGSSSSSSSKSLSTSLSLVEHNHHMSSSTGNVAQVVFDGESPKTPLQKGDSLHVLCETMKRQIISRAFYGWLAHCRHLRTVRTHLSGLVNETIVSCKEPADASGGVNNESWSRLLAGGVLTDSFELYRLTYYGGVAHHLRKQVWPYLLGHYPFGSTADQRESQDRAVQTAYETTMSEWLAVEAIIRQRDKEATAASIAKLSSGSHSDGHHDPEQLQRQGRSLSNEVFDDDFSDDSDSEVRVMESEEKDDTTAATATVLTSTDEATSQDGTTVTVITTHPSSGSEHASEPESLEARRASDEAIPRVLLPEEGAQQPPQKDEARGSEDLVDDLREHGHQLNVDDALDGCSIGSRSSCMSPASSAGGVYSMQLLETFGLNLHRIDKDVQRCDRNYYYFTAANLEKLRNIMCTYVWCHLDTGYMQGMCDLVAPLLVIIDDEALTYSCFCELMKRMASNFPQGGAMDNHFANMRSLIQILDAEIFDLMHQNGDYTHFYFCYRWFLLDFKRELVYDDVFTVWETIWAARSVASSHFVLFVALALVQYYRDIILSNAMDFTDIIKFFNEMAERHDAKAVLRIARELVLQLQTLIENK